MYSHVFCRVVNLRLQEPESALIPLRKLHAMLPDSPEVVHCIALAHDMMADTSGAIRWLEMLSTLVPNDPGVLCKLGAIYHRWVGRVLLCQCVTALVCRTMYSSQQ